MKNIIGTFLSCVLLSFAIPTNAQVGPCASGDTCPAEQICIGATGSRLCYKTCIPDALGVARECVATETCNQPTGFTQNVCTHVQAASTPTPAPTEAAAEAPFVPIVPELSVPIPGLSFVAPTKVDGTVTVSFLSSYINAAYRYLASISLVVAIVMCVYGGFLYLLGSAGISSVQRGKKIMTDAIAGMLLILTSFAILNTINSSTTKLKNLELGSIAGEVIEEPSGIEYGVAPVAPGTTPSPTRGSTDTTYDVLFQRYAGCAGLDWHILKAIAFKESGFRATVTNAFGYIGLFQVAVRSCALKSHNRAADCDRLTDPEINTAAAAVGQLRSGATILKRLCPSVTDPHKFVTLLYFGHNSGPGALQAVIRDVGCNATDAEYDQSSTKFWVDYSARKGRRLPINHDKRMAFARKVADVAMGYGLRVPTVPRSSCPVM